jgi:signal transduction histidine kinase
MMAAHGGTEQASLTSDDLASQETGIALLSADYTVISCNHGLENLTGYTLKAFDHFNLIELFDPVDTLRELLHRARAGESPSSERIRLRTADGRQLAVEVSCGVLQSRDCSTASIMLLIREVAPWHLQGHRAQRLPLLGRLAGELSHEIRNPINAIFLHADIVEEEVRQLPLSDRTQVVQSVATIKAELTRLHGLVQDYLFLARPSDLPRVPLDLRALLEELVCDMHSQCRLRGIALIQTNLEDLGAVALHQSSFRRALYIILQRLIDAVPQDATLTLSGGRTSCHLQLQIQALNKPLAPQVWGALQQSLRGKIPDPADLGMYVAQEIIAAHGGQLSVSNDARAGVLCTITLPLDTMG